MEITLKTLTPIWTGGIDGTSSKIQETGIIGSLRWWYEVVLRGLGAHACDPTGHECNFELDRYKKKKDFLTETEALKESGLCDACQAYGATGWRRRFKIDLTGGDHPFEGRPIRIRGGHGPRGTGWFIGNGLMGEIALNVRKLHPDWNTSSLLVPLLLAERWGGLGAKTQLGYGVFRNTDNIPEAKIDELITSLPKGTEQKYDRPNLKHFFFAKLQFTAYGKWWEEADLLKEVRGRELKELATYNTIPIAPTFKDWLRYGKRITNRQGRTLHVSVINGIRGHEANKEMFGFSGKEKGKEKEEENNRKAGYINISSAYLVRDNIWDFRVWGWIPPSKNYSRNQVLSDLHNLLNVSSNWQHLLGSQTSNARLTVWREFDSSRDTVRTIRQGAEYLKSLLSEE